MAQLQSTVVSGNTNITGIVSAGARKLSMGILELNSGGTPTQFRINTTIPYSSGNADFTVNIKGFRYGNAEMTSLSIGWHFYNSEFYNRTAICNGAWAPTITLARDANGYVVIHLAGPGYWPKMYVESVYSGNYNDAYSTGWTWTDADLSNCTAAQTVPYKALSTNITGSAGSTDFNNLTNKTGGTGTYQTSGSFRAPIFYDSENTAYYLDPNSTSILVRTDITNIYVGNAIYFGGGNNYLNWDGSRINSNVGIQSTSDMRAPIFYDSNDTSFFGDFASRSMMNKIEVSRNGAYGSYLDADLIVGSGAHDRRGYGQTGGSNIMLRSSAKSTITALDESQNLGQISYENLVWTIGEDIGWGNQKAYFPGDVGVGVSPISKLHVQAAVPSGVGGSPAGTIITVDNSGNNFITFRHSADNGTYAGLAFLDNNIGGYVVFGNSGANPSDSMAIAGYNGGVLQYGTANSVNPAARTTVVSWNSTGLQVNNGDLRASIFYDINDTSYYVDPNSTSRLNVLTTAYLNGHYTNTSAYNSSNTLIATPSGIRSQAAFITFTDGNAIAPYAMYRTSGDWPAPYGIGWGTGGESSGIFQQYASNNYSLGDMTFYINNDGTGRFKWVMGGWEGTTYNPSGSNNYNNAVMTLDNSGNLQASASMRAPIFYDSNDTSYYVDPNSSSNINSITTVGRIYSNEWIQFSNYTGLYSPNNGAHFRPNSGSYGPWLVTGTRNGWSGIEFESLSNGNVAMMIATSSNTSGWHNNSYGWQFKWDNGTAYVYKSAYGGGAGATVLDSSNYTSYAPSLTGSGASGTWSINITGNAGTATIANAAKKIQSDYQEWDFSWGSHTVTTPMSISIWDNYTQAGAPSGYGTLIDMYGLSGHQQDQFYFYQGTILHRYGWYGDNNWNGWYRVLTSNTDPYAANMNQYVRTSDNVEFNQVSIRGGLYVGTWGNSSDIYMTDGDEGTRRIHCNSNRIGFLNQSGNWGAWNDDNGNWGMSLNAYMAGNRFDIQGAEGQISFKDGDNVWTGYVGFAGNLGYLSFPGRNVKINSGYNGTITLETGVSGYNDGVVSIPYGRLIVNNNYIYSGSYIEAGSDMRAPIFYDSNNTAYYGNFASTSRMAYVTMDQSTGAHNHMTYGGYWSGGDWQTLTNTEGQLNVVQVNNINAGGYSNQPPNVYTYGGVLSWRTSNHSFQLYASHTGDITFKTQWNNDNYSGWRRILHESNFNTWAPTLTGGGASGTWGINISGNSSTTSQRNFSGDISTSGMGRFTGWYNGNAATGLAAEIGISSGEAYIIAYNRQTSSYGVLNLESSAATLRIGGSTVNVVNGSLQQGGNQVLHAGNYNSYAPTLTGGGASGTWGISITGNAGNTSSISNAVGSSYTWGGQQYFMSNLGGYSGSLSGPPLQAYSTSNNSAFMSFHKGGYYAVNMGLDADNVLRIGGWSASANRWELDMSGNNTVAGSFRAPIFYDSQNTAYYLDPSSTGTSLYVAGSVQGSYYVASNYASTGYTQYKGYDNNNHFIMIRGRVTGNTTTPTYTGYHRTSLVEYAEGNDDTGWFFQTAATGNYDIVARITRSYSQFEGSVRAPIFYDSNDTTYYLDPNSLSNLRNITVNHTYGSSILENGHGLVINGNYTNGQYSHRFRKWDDGGGVPLYMQFTSGTANSWSNLVRFGPWSSDGSYFRVFGGVLADSYIISTSDMRAPIFYDYNDTTYYADFANSGRSMYTAGYLQSDRMIMKGSSGGGQIYPTIAYGGMSIYGGDSLTNGAWITMTGLSYGSSPGAGSAEIIVRSETSSKIAMWTYNGSTYTGRAALWGSNGNFVIGSATTDYGYKLYVDGTIYATGNVIAYSDESVKTNVREIENPLARVLNTRGVIYDRIDNEDKDNIGFIAQELEKEFPELVSTGNNGKKGVMYQNMVAVLIEAMKEQNKEIQKLKMLINGASR